MKVVLMKLYFAENSNGEDPAEEVPEFVAHKRQFNATRNFDAWNKEETFLNKTQPRKHFSKNADARLRCASFRIK